MLFDEFQHRFDVYTIARAYIVCQIHSIELYFAPFEGSKISGLMVIESKNHYSADIVVLPLSHWQIRGLHTI